jgi:hypothetical protein
MKNLIIPDDSHAAMVPLKLSLTGLGLRQPSRRSRPSFRTRGASWGWRDSPFVHPFLNDSRAPRNTQVFSPSHEAWRKHPMLQVSYRSMCAPLDVLDPAVAISASLAPAIVAPALPS